MTCANTLITRALEKWLITGWFKSSRLGSELKKRNPSCHGDSYFCDPGTEEAEAGGLVAQACAKENRKKWRLEE